MDDRIDDLAHDPPHRRGCSPVRGTEDEPVAENRGSELLARLLADPERAARVAAIVNWMRSSEAELPPDNRGPITKEERERMLGYDPGTGV